VALTINRLWVNFPLADQRDKPVDTALELGRQILADQPPKGAIISGSHEENLSLDYLTQAWGERKDVRVVITDDFVELWSSGEENLYLTKAAAAFVLPQLSRRPRLSSQGLQLIAVRQRPNREMPTMEKGLEAGVGENLVLLGYDHFPSGEGLHLALYWQATDRTGNDYAVSVRPTKGGELLFHEGQLVQQDHALPCGAIILRPPGDEVRDDYLVPVPPGVEYDGVMVVVYRVTEEGFEDLGTVSFPLAMERAAFPAS